MPTITPSLPKTTGGASECSVTVTKSKIQCKLVGLALVSSQYFTLQVGTSHGTIRALYI